jgi:dTDP-glucose 4,6-dehydratase
VGTHELLDCVRNYWGELNDQSRENFRFVHVSTDEVYGALGSQGTFTEDSAYRPASPYAASKAAADHLVRAWHHTYGLPVTITNCSNNYGPFQFPEKLVPTVIRTALHDMPIPVYGKGENVRDWIYVDDHARALIAVAEKGRAGATYNIGAASERRNIDLVREICALLDRHVPRQDRQSYATQISFVDDRPGHDFRYAIDAGKIRSELGWAPLETFSSALEKTIIWYLDHRDWWEAKVVADMRHRFRDTGRGGGQH